MSEDLIVRKEGRAGRLTLNRPDALNALTYEMALAMEEALLAWRDDPDIALVILDGTGEKAFCAGGDVQALYRAGKAGDFAYGKRFWADEYRLNALIANYPKPYVALMDGITMGGGVGVSAHGSHRIVTERTMLAMPECGIGLIPDVGGSFILGKAPGHLGTYLGLTGTRLKADGAIHTGFADNFVPQERLPALVDALVADGDVAAIVDHAEELPEGNLRTIQAEVDAIFAADDPAAVLRNLEDASAAGNWQEEAAKAIRRVSPLSVLCSHHALAAARGDQRVEQSLAREYRFVSRCMERADFLEGVRALIIDKDRNPKWRFGSIDAAREEAEALMAPLGDEELKFGA